MQDEQTVSLGISSLSAGHVSNLAHVCTFWTPPIRFEAWFSQQKLRSQISSRQELEGPENLSQAILVTRALPDKRVSTVSGFNCHMGCQGRRG